MVVAFFACIGALALTGFLYTTDRFWGDETVERVHVALAWTIVVLAVVHVLGVWVASVRHRENLIAAMLHGKKRAAAAGDID
jgi:cytochrome b